MRPSSSTLTPALALILAASAPLPALAQPHFRTIILSGQPAPGYPDGTVFAGLGPPKINAAGHTAFSAGISGPASLGLPPLSGGVWSDRTGTLSLVAGIFDHPPGIPPGPAPGILFARFSSVRINDADRICFTGVLRGDGITVPNQYGIWAESAEALELIARWSGPAGDLPAGFTYDTVALSAWTHSGLVAYPGHYEDLDGNLWSASWIARPGNGGGGGGSVDASLIAAQGDPAPGASPGDVFTELYGMRMDPLDRAMFRGTIAGPDVTPGVNDRGLWFGTADSLTLVVRSGTPAPGAAPGALFTDFENPVADAAGRELFKATITAPGVTLDNDDGFWLADAGGGSLTPVLLEATPIPGIPGAVCRFGTSSGGSGQYAMNSSGLIVIEAYASGPGITFREDSILGTVQDGALHVIARERDRAPVAPGTPRLRFGGGVDFALNESGQIAIRSILVNDQGTDVGTGLWAAGADGKLRLVTHTGARFDVNDDPAIADFRTVSTVSIPPGGGGDDGVSTCLNDSGELAFFAQFTDFTSGTFVVDISTLRICPADWDGSDTVDSSDFFAFLADFFAGDAGAGADFNSSGATDSTDFFDFLASFLAGC